jgi:hypothetical protein
VSPDAILYEETVSPDPSRQTFDSVIYFPQLTPCSSFRSDPLQSYFSPILLLASIVRFLRKSFAESATKTSAPSHNNLLIRPSPRPLQPLTAMASLNSSSNATSSYSISLNTSPILFPRSWSLSKTAWSRSLDRRDPNEDRSTPGLVRVRGREGKGGG